MNTLNILRVNGPLILIRILKKSIIAASILVFVLLMKVINTKPTNMLLNTINNSINYDFSIVEDTRRIFNKSKDLLDDSQMLLEVFNLGEVDKYISPIQGTIHRSFDEDTNKGINIKSGGDLEPIAIASGIVKEVRLTDTKGYFVTIQSQDFEHIYGYLSKAYVTMGDTVETGEAIGYLGTNKDGQKYLRFEIVKNGEYKNPTNYIDIE